MRCACWTIKATHTHTHWEYVILIAFPRKRGLHERASMLRYTYIACLVTKHFFHNCCAVGFTSQSNSIASYIVANCKYVLRVATTPAESPGAVFPDKISALNCGYTKKICEIQPKTPKHPSKCHKITKRGKKEEMLQFHFLQCKLTRVQQLFVLTFFDMISSIWIDLPTVNIFWPANTFIGRGSSGYKKFLRGFFM